MKYAIPLTLTAMLLGTAALAAAVDDVVARMQADGYTEIEVETHGDRITVEGVLDGVEREVVLDRQTGAVLAEKTERDDNSGDDDDDEDDDDDGEGDDDGDDT